MSLWRVSSSQSRTCPAAYGCCPLRRGNLEVSHLERLAKSSLRLCLILWVLFFGVSPLPGLPADMKSLLDEARAYEKSEDYAGAERSYRQALALAPDDPEVLKRLGVLYQTELKFPESIELFQHALSVSAQHPEVNFFLGASYLGLNQFQKATESFQVELSTPSPHPRCHYYNAIALVSLGRPDDAITQFNQSLVRNPKDADALYQLGRLHMNASLAIIQRLTDLDPDSFQLHALIGEVYANNKRYEDSLKEYHAALAKRPHAPGLHYALGVAYRNLKQIDTAEKEFLEARREDPHDFRVNLYLGEFAVGRGNYGGAMDYLRVASQAQPGAARPHLLLGKCYHGLKDLERAKSELLLAVAADPTEPETHFLLAKVYREQGDTKSSGREMEEFQRLSLAEKVKTYERARTTPQ
jgi:tetratricopeptide (TPR) repeat protein